MNVTDSVIFHGWKSRSVVYSFLENAFLVAFPSIYPEAFGIVGIEAMYHGKPVVAFNVGGVSSWLSQNVSGFLVDVKDVNQFAEKMSLLTLDTELYKRMSNSGRAIVEEKFMPANHLETLKLIYTKAWK